jgi:ribosomal protein S14
MDTPIIEINNNTPAAEPCERCGLKKFGISVMGFQLCNSCFRIVLKTLVVASKKIIEDEK